MFKNRFLMLLAYASALLLVLALGCSEESTTEPTDNNTAPALGSIGAKTGYVNIPIEFETLASDSASDTLVMTAVDLPTDATYTDNEDGTADFAWTPEATGADTVIFIVSDGTLADSEVVVFTIEEAIELSSYTALIEEIAPPVFESGGGGLASMPFDEMDSLWTIGEYPLLGKVFGEEEPMSLYRNMEWLDEVIDGINMALEMGEIDTTVTEEDETFNIVVEIEELTSAVEIPEDCQPVLGITPIDLDYYVSCTSISPTSEDTIRQTDAGIKVTDTGQTILFFHKDVYLEEGPWYGSTGSFVFYANSTSAGAVDIKGVFFKELGDTNVMWGYEIQTVEASDFQYRMTWYSNELEEMEFVARIIGGGNKDEEFVLRYQDFDSPDSTTAKLDISQLFEPTAENEWYYDIDAAIPTELEGYIDSTLYYDYDDLPTELLTNPLADPADLINPWGGE